MPVLTHQDLHALEVSEFLEGSIFHKFVKIEPFSIEKKKTNFSELYLVDF